MAKAVRASSCVGSRTMSAAVALARTEITIEVRLITAVLDGIGLQWLLDPSTDVVTTTATYVDRTIGGWCAAR
jgi:hypothetical protein